MYPQILTVRKEPVIGLGKRSKRVSHIFIHIQFMLLVAIFAQHLH